MPKFKAKQELYQTVIQTFWEEFDTEDQDQWESLKSRVEESSGEDLEDYPSEAPSDPSVWFQLYQMLYHIEYENCEDDDWFSDRKGSTEHQYQLEDSNSDVIDSA